MMGNKSQYNCGMNPFMEQSVDIWDVCFGCLEAHSL